MVRYIFVNLKRFDVPRELGGLCPVSNPSQWIQEVIKESVRLGLGRIAGLDLTYILPEGVILEASRQLEELSLSPDGGNRLTLGCQTVHWQDIQPGGNFGAFTSSLPAKAARNLGCSWAMVGHSEERKAKYQVLEAYNPHLGKHQEDRQMAANAIDKLIQCEVNNALAAGLDLLLCVGESEQERGQGPFEEQSPRIQKVLKQQLVIGLSDVKRYLPDRKIVIGYEPIWAIGPGKTPPGKEYIAFVSKFIKGVVKKEFGFEPGVVYGGGLKEVNAPLIASIATIDGGLVALTRFRGQIGFKVSELEKIMMAYNA
jgi:triosephosphate isomerase